MKTLPTLAIVALAIGLIAAKAPSKAPSHAPRGEPAASPFRIHDVIGASRPMPDFFGSILTTR